VNYDPNEQRNNFAVENINNSTGATVRVIECKTKIVAKSISESANTEFTKSKRNYTSIVVEI
jgi:hypothetical protein